MNQKNIDEFINNSNLTMSQTINTITSIITSIENRIDNRLNINSSKIDDLHKNITDSHFNNVKLQQNVTEMLKKFEKGSGKGNVSENVLYNILLSLFVSL